MSYSKQDNDMIQLSGVLQNNVGRKRGIIPNEADLIEHHHFCNQYTGVEVGTGRCQGNVNEKSSRKLTEIAKFTKTGNTRETDTIGKMNPVRFSFFL